jgi:hypothetical protein
VPAAAVIPAPVAYIKVAAVKKLVVEVLLNRVKTSCVDSLSICLQPSVRPLLVGHVSRRFTLRKLECFRQALAGIH